ncbi:MAG: MFS transporter [Candidatus Bathyarchaeia archaeon]
MATRNGLTWNTMVDPKGRQLNLLMVVQMAGSFRMGIVAPILALLIRRHGVSIIEIGVLGVAGMLGWLIFEPLSGVISDRVNRRVMIAFSIVSTSIIYLLYPFATVFSHFLILAFALSSFSSASSVPTRALLSELLPSSSRGHTYGRYMAIVSGSSVIAPFVGGYVSDVIGYALPFYAAGGVGVIALIAVILMGKPPEADKKKQRLRMSITEVLKGNLVTIYLVRGLYFFNSPFRSNFLPILLNESTSLQATETEIGTYMTIVSFTGAISQTFLGDLIDRIGSGKIVTVVCGILAFSYLGMLAVNWVPILFVIGALQGVLQAGADTSMMMHLIGIQSRVKTGVVMGLYAESENIGGIVANPALGYVYTGFGPLSSLVLVSGILFLAAGISITRLRAAPISS